MLLGYSLTFPFKLYRPFNGDLFSITMPKTLIDSFIGEFEL